MDKIKAIDLALKAARKRQSPRTGFVHLFQDEDAPDTIPFFENVCFALALLRQKQTDAVMEAKELLERLLHFQTKEGNFPVYLHEFPRCHDRWMGLKIAPLFLQIVRHFSLGLSELKERLLHAIDRVLQFAEPLEKPPLWEHRFRKLRKETSSFMPMTQEEWYHFLISEQLGNDPISLSIPYHSNLQVFLGGNEVQERGEPRPCPIEWALAETDGFQERLLQDHPAVVRAAALFPIVHDPALGVFTQVQNEEGIRFLWKGTALHPEAGNPALKGRVFQKRTIWEGYEAPPKSPITIPGLKAWVHSLSIPKGKWMDRGQIECDFTDLETAFFCDISKETDITIDGKKGTVFFLGQNISIHTPTLKIFIRFDLVKGKGDFCGSVSRSNRPAEIGCKGAHLHAAFDWKIALRTLRCESDCQVVAAVTVLSADSLDFENALLSTASPIACMPLST